jgi:hypothetical protein
MNLATAALEALKLDAERYAADNKYCVTTRQAMAVQGPTAGTRVQNVMAHVEITHGIGR